MPRKFDKRWLVEQVTVLRQSGLTLKEIQERIGISNTYLTRVIQVFGITKPKGVKKPKLCPHCLLDTNSESP